VTGKTVVLLTMAAFTALLVMMALVLGSLGSAEFIEREPLTIVAANGTTARLDVEIAETAEERERGLSGRSELPQDTGMLFVLRERGPGFWMKDTSIPLSVAFIEECGQIVDIQDMRPHTLDLHNTGRDYSFGLEVNQGWFARNGIAVGDIVSLPRHLRSPTC
jgi:uncharacterized protein